MTVTELIHYIPSYQLITIQKGNYGLSLFPSQPIPTEWDCDVSSLVVSNNVLVVRVNEQD